VAFVSNQWLKPIVATTRDPWHSPNPVAIVRDNTRYNWARANDLAAVYKLSLKGGEYQVLGLEGAEAVRLVDELISDLDLENRGRIALALLDGLSDQAFLAVISKAAAKRARRASRHAPIDTNPQQQKAASPRK
jgi:hypothetical protein